MSKFLMFLFIFGHQGFTIAQSTFPILQTTTEVLSIKDGDVLKQNYWTVDPSLPLDVYVADKLNQTKIITFYSDTDSLSFEIDPLKTQKFAIVLNEKDTCWTQVKSGISFVKMADTPLTHDTIPFTLTKANNVIIQSSLNDGDSLRMMFHTAQGSVSLTEEAITKLGNKNFDKSEKAITWGGEATTEYSEGNQFKIQNFEWNDLTIWSDKHTGPTADGKFGPNLFPDKVIELDFDKNLMIIHSYLPEIDESFQKAQITFNQNMMFLNTEYIINDHSYRNPVLLHSGYGGTLLLDDKFVEKNKFGELLETISESELKDSHDNVIKTKRSILPQFKLGEDSFKNIPINFFEGALGRQHLSVMGGDILKRFNLYIDLQYGYLYYRPNGLYNIPFGS